LPEAYHRESLRDFMCMTDPTTGFIADE